jgi:N-acetylmuramoyl-L-alanine amidase
MILLDNGHSGLVNGVYVTPGKRSPDFGKGVYFEGVGNRDIVKRIFEKLCEENILCHLLVPENEDISLAERVRRANILHKQYKNAILISVHSDAASNSSASGFSVWTTKGYTKSDEIATIIHEEMEKIFPDQKARTEKSDNDVDFEADFYVLKNTTCPAILTENFFMTNEDDYNLLMSEEGREKIAIAHVNAIKRIVNI